MRIMRRAISRRPGARTRPYFCVRNGCHRWMLSWGGNRRELVGKRVISKKRLSDIKWMCNCASAWGGPCGHGESSVTAGPGLMKYVFLFLSLCSSFFYLFIDVATSPTAGVILLITILSSFQEKISKQDKLNWEAKCVKWDFQWIYWMKFIFLTLVANCFFLVFSKHLFAFVRFMLKTRTIRLEKQSLFMMCSLKTEIYF